MIEYRMMEQLLTDLVAPIIRFWLLLWWWWFLSSQDLAALVDGQQEQIDKLEEHAEETKANTKAGLEQFQYTMWKMCGQQQQVEEEDGVVVGIDPTSGTPLILEQFHHCRRIRIGRHVMEQWTRFFQ
jgi:hypothetical protein